MPHFFLAVFHFLGPVVNNLQYWGSKEGTHVWNRQRKLDPENDSFGEAKAKSHDKRLGFKFLDSSLPGFASSIIIPRSWIGCPLLKKWMELFHVVLKKRFLTYLLLLMVVRFSLKHQQTYK